MRTKQQLKIPSFLLKDASLSDLQRLALWREVYPSEPFDRVRAVALQRRLWKQERARRLKQAQRKTIEQTKAAKKLLALRWRIAQFCFTCELVGNPDEVEPVGEVDWDVKIRDLVTGKSVGTPSALWRSINLQFVGDVSPYADLVGYLDSIKAKFNEFERDFSFNREHLNPSLRYNAGEKRFSFTLWLSWKPASSVEVAKKLRKLLVQTAR